MSQYSVKFDEAKRHAVYHRDGYKCHYCGKEDETGKGVGLSLDHITSRASGGDPQNTKTSPADNLITACHACNFAKQDKTPREWNAYVKARQPPEGGLKVEWSAIRRQAAKKIDIKKGEELSVAARAYRTERDAARKDSANPEAKKSDERGPGIHHGEDGKFLPGSRIAFARSVETAVSGAAPTAARLWRAGWNKTDKGDLRFTARSARLVMEDFEQRGNPLAFYYEHEDRIPLEKRGGAPMRGVCSAPSSVLVVRDTPEGPECWAEQIGWTAEAKRQIESGERRQISPIAAFDEETREILKIQNVSLCSEGATHHGTILASAGKGTSMDELIQGLLDALDAGDFDKAQSILDEIKAQGHDDVAAMGSAMMGKYRAMSADTTEKKDPAKVDDVATKKIAATTPTQGSTAATAALSREIETLRAQTAAAQREAKIGRVEGIIAASRDCFDAVDEREHLRRADPEATRAHVASIARKRKEGELLATRGAGDTGVKPPKERPGDADDSHGLTTTEIQEATRMKVSLPDFKAAKDRQSANAARGGK